jgi:hypothetical protein
MLRVYHTPEMQAVVADITDRFVNSASTAYGFTLRVATVGNPNWRAKALTMMTPIPVQSPGVQGWILAKENARLLVSELGRRTDYREYNSSQQLVNAHRHQRLAWWQTGRWRGACGPLGGMQSNIDAR